MRQTPLDSPSSPPLLEVRSLVKLFSGVRALDRVDFTLHRGKIHTLLGQNGAGKSTLIKVVTGVHQPDGGKVLLEGRQIRPRSPLEAQHLGISTVYQEVNLIQYLSVAENIFLGREPMKFGRIDWKQINRKAVVALEKLDIHLDVTQMLGHYPIAIQQMVAIARSLDVEAKVLVLDEPTSSLDTAEVKQLFAVMRKLRDEGLGIIFITHFLNQAYEISDRFTVLRNGAVVGQWQPASLGRLELIGRMIGKDVEAVKELTVSRKRLPVAPSQQPLLKARRIGRRGAMAPLDLDIRSAEVVGLAGLLGSGRTEIARMLFGVDPADTGSVEIDGRRAKLNSPAQAIALGLGFCPEDRKNDALIPDLSVRENIILVLQASMGLMRRLSRQKQDALAQHYIEALNIDTPDAERPIKYLSGGNQQKVILARWLASQRRLLILDEPTRGIDVGAKAEVERLIYSLCEQGMAIVFISSELEEIVRDSHRVVVLRDRSKIGELSGSEINLPAIMEMIASHETSD